ncbi:hypothetical protein BDF14DRAFT_1882053 [Spinellus fusiger]|nr:hypothetical protein BDF14DRAFT_1882053 [Spinellus fusiger]
MDTKQLKHISLDSSLSDRRRSNKRMPPILVPTLSNGRWATKEGTETRHYTTKPLSSPFLSPSDDEKRKQQPWTDVINKKSNANKSDPFTGMKQCVDYQQEIERLKTLVPKVDTKKRAQRPFTATTWNETNLRPINKSMSSKKSLVSPSTRERPMSSLGLSFNPKDIESEPCRVRSVTAPHSPVSSKHSTPTISPTPSHSDISDDSLKATPEAGLQTTNDNPITEEEKTRFIEFVRSWTGGWKGREDESMKKTSSLWADPSPWDFTPDRHRILSTDPKSSHSLVAASTLTEHYWQSSAAQIVFDSPYKSHPFIRYSGQPKLFEHEDMQRNDYITLHTSTSATRPYLYRKHPYQPPGYPMGTIE